MRFGGEWTDRQTDGRKDADIEAHARELGLKNTAHQAGKPNQCLPLKAIFHLFCTTRLVEKILVIEEALNSFYCPRIAIAYLWFLLAGI